MIAVDANVVLRLILGDDDAQVAAIRRLMARALLFVPITVVLEVGWVLESRYRLPRSGVTSALTGLLALGGVEVARADLVRWALDRYMAGADWADVIHVAASSKLDGFATLDRGLHRRASIGAPVPIELVA